MSTWFKEWFADKFYLELYQHRDEEDARWIINLLQRSIPVSTKSKVLDIACGSGRHSLELARRGFDVTGFDLSGFLINEAKINLKNSKEKSLRVKFMIKDMRNFNFNNSFDIAVNFFTSFGYFEDDSSNMKVLKNTSDSLKKGGYFVFDFLNRKQLEKNLVPESMEKYGKVTVRQKRVIKNGFVRKDIYIKEGKKERHFEEVLKLYSYTEFRKMFALNKLRIVRTFGDYFGNSYSESKSKRLIIIAQKS